jgi:hypothetical protein
MIEALPVRSTAVRRRLFILASPCIRVTLQICLSRPAEMLFRMSLTKGKYLLLNLNT